MDAFLGNESLLTELGSGAAKGTLVASRVRYVREEHGPEAVGQVAAALEPEAREAFENPPLPFTWTPLPLMVAIDRAIVDGPMGGDPGEMFRFGSLIAGYDLPVIYKVLFKVGSPGFIVGRASMVYSQYFRGGKLRSTVDGKRATAVLEGFVQPRYMCAEGMRGWLHASVSMSGGRNTGVEHPECVHAGDERCTWTIGWE